MNLILPRSSNFLTSQLDVKLCLKRFFELLCQSKLFHLIPHLLKHDLATKVEFECRLKSILCKRMSEYNKTKCLMPMLFRYGSPVDHIPFFMTQFDLSSSNQASISIRTNVRNKTLKYPYK